MLETILILLLLAIAVEATTEILTSSKLIGPFQNKWKQWTYPLDRPPSGGILRSFKVFVDDLWSCGYCSSVWVAAFFGLFAPPIFDNTFINWLVAVFVLHRLANWLHVAYELIRRGRVSSLDIMLRISENEDGTIGQSLGEAATTIESEHPETG